MNIKQKKSIFVSMMLIGLAISMSAVNYSTAYACTTRDAGFTGQIADECPAAPAAPAVPKYKGAQDCGGTSTSIIGGQICSGANSKSSDTQANPIWKLLIFALTIMTAGVGILGVGGIVYGSILYASAGDKAEQTKKAIGVISNTVIGLIAYAFMYLLLNFLIPGGIFTK